MSFLKLKFLLVYLMLGVTFLNAQGELKAVEGYSPNIGMMVYMLEDLKGRIIQQVKDLDQTQVDFMYDNNANSIGALLMHLISTESYYQVVTLKGRDWTKAERQKFGIAGEINNEVKHMLKGMPVAHYLKLWNQVRNITLKELKTKDDAWFASNIEEGMNYHYVWYQLLKIDCQNNSLRNTCFKSYLLKNVHYTFS